MTILEYLQDLDRDDRAARVGCVDNALLGLRGLAPETVAAASWKTWACPEYLAEALGFVFECKHPRTGDPTICEGCAAAFLRAQYPNTGRAKKWKK